VMTGRVNVHGYGFVQAPSGVTFSTSIVRTERCCLKSRP
jgi:hypothetical protein